MKKYNTNLRLWFVMGIVLFFAVLLQVNAQRVTPAIPPSPAVTPAIPKAPSAPENPTLISLEGKWKFQIDPEDNGLDKKWNESKYDDSKWKEINVPSYWENEGITTENSHWTRDDLNEPYSGYAWYRKTVKIPTTWVNNTVFLELGKVDDLDWTYWNGELVGHVGEENENTYKENRLYAIPPQKIKAGKENVIAVRVCDIRGKGGMYEGPVQLSFGVKPEIESNESYAIKRGDLVKIGESIHVNANEEILGDVVSIGGSVKLNGKVTGNVVSIGGDVTVTSTARVNGDAVTVGGQLNVEPGGVVKGQSVSVAPGLHYMNYNWGARPAKFNGRHGLHFFWIFIFIAIVFTILFVPFSLLTVVVVPERIQRIANALTATPAKSFGFGCLWVILIIPITLLLLLSCIGIPLIPVWIILLIVIKVMAYTTVALVLGTKLVDAFKWNVKSLLALTFIGIVLIGIILMIPILGWLVAFGLQIFGCGAVIMTKFGKPNGSSVPPNPPTT